MKEQEVVKFQNSPIVIDSGSGNIRGGFAGQEKPDVMFQSLIGRPKYRDIMKGALKDDYFIGKRAQEYRGLLKLSYPTKHGVTQDWEDMAKIWDFTFKELGVEVEEHPVLITEPALNPVKNKTTAAQHFFEKYNSPAFYSQNQSVLSLYGSGRTTGVVLDSGAGTTTAVPIYEGFSLSHAITRIDVGGRDVTEYLQILLRKGGYTFHTSAEMEIVRDIKEKHAYVAYSIKKQEKDLEQDLNQPEEYKLPDNQEIKIGPERFRAPEVLFDPSLIGLEYDGTHKCLVNSIQSTDIDLRKKLYENIILSGGSTLFSGFGDRLLSETKKLASKDLKIRIFAPQERLVSAWIGGSILSSLASFQPMWITRKEWSEFGPTIVHRKCF